MAIRDNHFFLTSAPEIRELSKPLCSLGIEYFSYSRHYNNGGRLWLCNTPENVEHYHSNKLYRFGNTEAKPRSYQAQIVLWSTLPNQNVLEFLKHRGIGNGIFIIQPRKEYCEFLTFAGAMENHEIINTYCTHLDWLKKFGSYFQKEADSLINIGEKNKIFLPYHNKKIPKIANPNSSFLMGTNLDTPIQLSQRQAACARLLLEGKTIKQIATILSLSPRTVETYINNLKIKFSCENKTILIKKLIKLFDTNSN